jgi:gliding motility-associated-like protein
MLWLMALLGWNTGRAQQRIIISRITPDLLELCGNDSLIVRFSVEPVLVTSSRTFSLIFRDERLQTDVVIDTEVLSAGVNFGTLRGTVPNPPLPLGTYSVYVRGEVYPGGNIDVSPKTGLTLLNGPRIACDLPYKPTFVIKDFPYTFFLPIQPNTGIGPYRYAWSFGSGDSLGRYTFTGPAGSTEQIGVNVTGKICQDECRFPVRIVERSNVADEDIFRLTLDDYCKPLKTKLVYLYGHVDSLIINWGDGTEIVPNVAAGDSIAHIYRREGVYNVSVTLVNQGRRLTINRRNPVTVTLGSNAPSLAFQDVNGMPIDVYQNTRLYAPGGSARLNVLNIINNTPLDSLNRYEWFLSRIDSDTVINVALQGSTNPGRTIVFEEAGDYSLYLRVTDEAECERDTTIKIRVLDAEKIIMPTVFTPNGDGINDVYDFETTGFINFNFVVMDRWGHQVFSTSGNERWDGTSIGGKCPAGVYVYWLEGTTITNKQIKRSGTINLIR